MGERAEKDFMRIAKIQDRPGPGRHLRSDRPREHQDRRVWYTPGVTACHKLCAKALQLASPHPVLQTVPRSPCRKRLYRIARDPLVPHAL